MNEYCNFYKNFQFSSCHRKNPLLPSLIYFVPSSKKFKLLKVVAWARDAIIGCTPACGRARETHARTTASYKYWLLLSLKHSSVELMILPNKHQDLYSPTCCLIMLLKVDHVGGYLISLKVDSFWSGLIQFYYSCSWYPLWNRVSWVLN